MSCILKTVIGRFSLFHNGHAALIEKAVKSADAVLIQIGSSFGARTIKNPFTFEERKEQIESWYKSTGMVKPLFILPLMDSPYNDSEWINLVQQNVLSVEAELQSQGVTDIHRVLVGADRDSSTFYLHVFGQFFEKEILTEEDTGVEFSLSATKARELLFGDEQGQIIKTNPVQRLQEYVPKTTYYFLMDWCYGNSECSARFSELRKEFAFIQKYKQAWEAAPYAPTFVTTDAVVIQSGHVLVNIRDNYPGVGLYAFPGGFLEQDETIMKGTVRELIEETRISLAPAQILGSAVKTMVFDSPERSLRGRTITHATLFRLNDSKDLPKIKPQAGEVRKCMWLPIAEALADPTLWFEDHFFILQALLWQS